MKTFKKTIISLFATLGIFTLIGCNKQTTPEYVSPTITLSETKIIISEGESFKLTATTSETSMIVYWYTRDISIATVDNEGLITAVNSGNTICYAKVGQNTAMCSVTILAYSPESILYVSSNLEVVELNVGDVFLLPLEVTYGDEIITDYEVKAEIEDTSICTFNDGSVTALKEGMTTILLTITYKGMNDQYSFVIINN